MRSSRSLALLALLLVLAIAYGARINKDRGIFQSAKQMVKGALDVTKGTGVEIVLNAAKHVVTHIKDSIFGILKSQAFACNADDPSVDKTKFCRAADLNTLLDCNHWGLAARAARLAVAAYGDARAEKPARVQVLDVFNGGEHSADAFVSIRAKRKEVPCLLDLKKRHPPLSAEQQAERNKLWKEAEDAEAELYQVGSSEAPFALEINVRGTAGLADALQDAKVKQLDWKIGGASYGKVHLGFHQQFEALRPKIENLLNTYKNHVVGGKTKLIFTGHSLGGAVCQLLAHYFTVSWKLGASNRAFVFTFGSPRVGDHTWAKAMMESTLHYRFKFSGDVVPEVPPPKIGPWRYEHAGTYSIAIGFLTPDYTSLDWWFDKSSARYSFYCLQECGPFTTRLDMLGLFHSSDMSYSTALELGFKTIRNSFDRRSMWQDTMDDDTDTEMMNVARDASRGDAAKVVMQCYGNRDCELQLQFPGTTQADRKECARDAGRNPIGLKWFHDLANVYTGAEPLAMFAGKLKESNFNQYKGIDNAVEVYNGCMQKKVKKDYYGKLSMDDWGNCRGDVNCIEKKRVAKK